MPKDRGRAMAIPTSSNVRQLSIKPEGGKGVPPENHPLNKPRTRGSSEPRTPQQTHHQQEQRFGKRGSGQAFALGLFQILKTEDPKIIGWSPSGKAFRIGDSEKFCKDIMPRFFKQNKYSSFQRQLNLYGFRKLVRGNEAGGYMHPLFERGKPEQLSQVRRGYFPDIPPEFAHDVHGHGLDSSGTSTTDAGGSGNGGSSRAPRGRKPDMSTHDMASMGYYRGERSTSVGPMGRAGMLSSAARAAVNAVNMAAASTDTQWEGSGGRLPPLSKMVPGSMNMNGVRQGGAAEMPPTLERLVSSADTGLSRESSPMKPTVNGNRYINGGIEGTGHGALSMSNASQLMVSRTPHDGQNAPPAFGRSQDDLNLTPRSHFLSNSFDWSPNNSFQETSFHGQQAHDLFVGKIGNRNQPGNSPRILQQTHSRDDMDIYRPSKTRRYTGPNAEDPFGMPNDTSLLPPTSQLAANGLISRRFAGPSGSGYGGGLDEPPAPPGRLGSRDNTPFRPGRSSTGSLKPSVTRLDPSVSSGMDMEVEGDISGSAGSLVSRVSELGKHGYIPVMSPVTVGPNKGFSGRMQHQHQMGGGHGEVTPDRPTALMGDSPSSTRSGGSGAGGRGGGVGLTDIAKKRMKEVKNNPVDISKLNLNEAPAIEGSTRHQQQKKNPRQQPQQQYPQQLMQAHPKHSKPSSSSNVSGFPSHKRDVSGGGSSGRRSSASDPAELLRRRRSSVDEVIGLLSQPPNSSADGGFEDDGTSMQNCDPAQFDSWRNSLTKVLGHLGFDVEDEQGVPLLDGKHSPDGLPGSARGTSQYLSWGGTSAMSFEDRPEEFHESLKQIPMRWRSSLSSIMNSIASNGAFDDNGGQSNSAGEGGNVDMELAGGGKRLEQQASLEMLQSVMRETLESMSGGQDHVGEDGGEEEAKAAATAALAMGSMCRDKDSVQGSASGGGELNSNGGGGGGGRSGRSYPRGDVASAVPGDGSVAIPSGNRNGYYGQLKGYNHERTAF